MPDAKVELDKIDTSRLPKLTEERKAFLEWDVEIWGVQLAQSGTHLMAKYVGVDGLLIEFYKFF